MRTNYRINSGVRFQMLSEDQLQELFDGVLHVLEHTGLEVHHDGALDILREAGAWVEGKRVRVPPYLVGRALEMSPRSFTIFARDGNAGHDVRIGPGRAHFGPGPAGPHFIDVETMERRPYVRDDASAVAKLVDALPNMDFCESLGTVGDVPRELAAVYAFAEMFSNTSKPVVARPCGQDAAAAIHEIAVAEAGGQEAFGRRPSYLLCCGTSSPLALDAGAMDVLIFAARHRVPVVFSTQVLAGESAPATAAGAVIQAAAGAWVGLIVAQAIQPGLPFIMGGVLSMMDVDSETPYYGAPELSLMMAGMTELAHYAGLPAWQTGGGTDSKMLDEQAAIEGALSCYFSAVCGGDLCHAVGHGEGATTGSVFQLVLMDEAIGYTRRITRGIEVNEDTLAVGVIHNVGPNGHYLREEHTRRHYRTEYWYPNLCDRRNFEEWDEMGRLAMRDRVAARVQDILATHQPAPVKLETEKAIAKVLKAAEKRVR